jgi:probable blue pigment (indigoidine) exporter
MQHAPHYLRDSLLTAIAPMLWGTTYILTTQVLPPDRPYTAAVIRVIPAGLILLAWARCLHVAGG